MVSLSSLLPDRLTVGQRTLDPFTMVRIHVRQQNHYYYSCIKFGGVRIGNQRGKKLGFPTANTNLYKNIPEGIYISKTKINNKIYPSLTFIGRSITFNETEFKAETHLLSYKKSLYNTWISIDLVKKLRENKRFDSAEDLIKQMEKDKKDAQEYFKKKKDV